jgi:hypothetical protein
MWLESDNRSLVCVAASRSLTRPSHRRLSRLALACYRACSIRKRYASLRHLSFLDSIIRYTCYLDVTPLGRPVQERNDTSTSILKIKAYIIFRKSNYVKFD